MHDRAEYPRTPIVGLRKLIPRAYVRREWIFSAAARLGAYREHREVDMSDVHRIVFVCKGNICRSPFAEGIARSVGVNAISYGLNAKEGQPADHGATLAAGKFGVSLDFHRTRLLRPEVIALGDLLVVMQPDQLTSLARVIPRSPPAAVLLGMWTEPLHPYVFDPYGLPMSEFDRCFGLIRDATLQLAAAWEDAGHARSDRVVGSMRMPPD